MLFDFVGVVEGEAEDVEDFYPLFSSLKEGNLSESKPKTAALEVSVNLCFLFMCQSSWYSISCGFWTSAISISKQQKKGCFPRSALSSDEPGAAAKTPAKFMGGESKQVRIHLCFSAATTDV